MKRMLLTHIDLDGMLPVLLAKYFKEDFDKITVNDYKMYEDVNFDYTQFLQYDEIVFTDFSPNQTLLDLIIDNNIKLTIIDHHQSFYDVYQDNVEKLQALETKGLVEVHFDNTKSGTLLYFEYLKEKFPNVEVTQALEALVMGVNNYDLFKTDLDSWEFSLNLNRLLWKNYNWYAKDNSPKRFEKYIKLLESKVYSSEPISFNRYEQNAIADTKEKESDAYKKAISNMLIRTDEKGHKFGIARMRSKVSITAFNILKNFKQLDYLLIINEFTKTELKMSGRARKGVNLLALNYTKGHKEACGCKDLSQRAINQFWRGKSMYELGYDTEYIDDPNKILETIHKKY